MEIPIVSVGNLIVGGSGKTPVTETLAKTFEKPAIVLRGYGRKSKGLIEVSRFGKILVDVERSGDEAMMLAKALPKACVIVSERREEGIDLAKRLGCEVVFLDDGFGKCFEKFDLLIDPDPPNRWCLPSGPYRLPRFFIKMADVVMRENEHFVKEVKILNPTPKMVLLTAIANPDRLEPFLPKGIEKYTFLDHHRFTKDEVESIWRKEAPTSFLVTPKDAVKLERFGYPLSLLSLSVTLDEKVMEKVHNYIKDYRAKKDTDCSDAS